LLSPPSCSCFLSDSGAPNNGQVNQYLNIAFHHCSCPVHGNAKHFRYPPQHFIGLCLILAVAKFYSTDPQKEFTLIKQI
jgi:hypothetical protein